MSEKKFTDFPSKTPPPDDEHTHDSQLEPKENGSKCVEELKASTSDTCADNDKQHILETSFQSDDDVSSSQDFLVSETQADERSSAIISPSPADDHIVVPGTPPHVLDSNKSSEKTYQRDQQYVVEELDYEYDDDDWNEPTQVLSKETIVYDVSFDGSSDVESQVIDESAVSKQSSDLGEKQLDEWKLKFLDMDTPTLGSPVDVSEIKGLLKDEYESAINGKECKDKLTKGAFTASIVDDSGSSDDENLIAPSQTAIRSVDVLSRIPSQDCGVTNTEKSNSFEKKNKVLVQVEETESTAIPIAKSDKTENVCEMQVVRASDVKFSVSEGVELPATQKISADSVGYLKEMKLSETQSADSGDLQELPPTQIIMPLGNGYLSKYGDDNDKNHSANNLPEAVVINEIPVSSQAKEVLEVLINNLSEGSDVLASGSSISDLKEQVDSALSETPSVCVKSNELNVLKGQITMDMSNEKCTDSLDDKQILIDEGMEIAPINTFQENALEKEVNIASSYLTGSEIKDGSHYEIPHPSTIEGFKSRSQMLPPLYYHGKLYGSIQRKSAVSATEIVETPNKKTSTVEMPCLDISDFKLERNVGTFKSAEELNSLLLSIGFSVDHEKLQSLTQISGNEEKLIFNKHLHCSIILKENTLIQKWTILDQSDTSPWSLSVSSNKTSSFTSLQSGDMADVSSIPSSNPSSKGSQSRTTTSFPSQESIKVTAITPLKKSPQKKETFVPPFQSESEDVSDQNDFLSKDVTPVRQISTRSTSKLLTSTKKMKIENGKRSSRRNIAKAANTEPVKRTATRRFTRSNQADESTSTPSSESAEKSLKKTIRRKISSELKKKLPKANEKSISVPVLINEPSDESTDKEDRITLNSRVMAKWADGFYYSGTVKRKEYEGLWVISFDDGEVLTVNENDVLNFNILKPGADVLAKSNRAGIYEQGTIKSVSKRGNAIGYIIEHKSGFTKWYSKKQIVLSQEQCRKLKNSKSSVVNENLGDVSAKRKFEQSSDIQDVENSSNKRKRKKVLSSSEISGNDLTNKRRIKGPVLKLFHQYMFLISEKCQQESNSNDSGTEGKIDMIVFNREKLSNDIKSSGGIILDKFEDVYKHPKRKAILVANTYLRTLKYFHCVATGIPCVKHDFVHNSITQNQIQDYKLYLLPTGYSIMTNVITEWHYSTDVFKNLKAVVTSDKDNDDNFVDNWAGVLHSGKVEIVQKYTLPTNAHPETFIPDVIITNKGCPTTILAAAKRKKIPLVSFEWIIQCVISGIRHPYDAHEKFKHNYCSKSG